MYFQSYSGMSEARPYPFPASAYGVLSWWDPGYWIVRIAHRIPNANPTQANIREAAEFFLATDEAAARASLDRLGSRYVIASSEMPAWSQSVSRGGRTGIYSAGYFWAMAAAAGEDERRYFETFYERAQDGTLMPRLLYYPDYYRTMVTRLYVYGGSAGEPRDSTFVAVYSDEAGPSGERRKMLQSLQPMTSYEEAVRQAESHPGGNARVVGVDPFRTSVPLEALETLGPVHVSTTIDARAGETATADDSASPRLVQIFEYLPGRLPAAE